MLYQFIKRNFCQKRWILKSSIVRIGIQEKPQFPKAFQTNNNVYCFAVFSFHKGRDSAYAASSWHRWRFAGSLLEGEDWACIRGILDYMFIQFKVS